MASEKGLHLGLSAARVCRAVVKVASKIGSGRGIDLNKDAMVGIGEHGTKIFVLAMATL
ncbi:hypothetical protein GYH30_049545 [Glycine max]|nr:hypothetical protein GYH30_049545 [Glycine max]